MCMCVAVVLLQFMSISTSSVAVRAVVSVESEGFRRHHRQHFVLDGRRGKKSKEEGTE